MAQPLATRLSIPVLDLTARSRRSRFVPLLASAVVAGALMFSCAHAATIQKANNTTALQTGSSWVGLTAPGSADIGLWDSTVTGANTVSFSGGTWLGIQIGSLLGGNPGGPVTVNLGTGSTWTVGNSAGSSTVVDMSNATQDLTINNGFFRIQGGSGSTITMNVAPGTAFTLGSQLTATGNNKTLSLTGGGNINLNGAVNPGTNPFGFAVNGANVTLNGANTFNLGSGSFAVNSGTLNLGNDAALGGVGTVLLNGGTLTAAGAARAIASNVTLGGAATLGGSSALTVNGNFTNSGGNRTLTVTNSAQTTLAGNVLLSESNTTARTLTIDGTGNVTISGVVSNSPTGTNAGGLTYNGSGVLALANANTFSGPLTVNGAGASGSVRLDHANAAQNATVSVVLSNGLTFGTGITAATVGGLSGAGNVTLANTDGAGVNLTVGNNNATTTYSGVLSGAGSLTKIGSGTTILSTGGQSYAGTTTVSGGTLQSNANGNTQGNIFGAGAVNLDGGRVRFNTTSTLTINSGVDVSANAGTLSFRGNSTFAPGSLTGTGALTLEVDNGITLTPATFGAFGGTVNVSTTGTAATLRLAANFDNASLASAKLDLGAGISMTRNAGTSGTVTTAIGTLSGSATATLGGSGAGAGTFIFSVGGRNEDATFAGSIVDGGTKTAFSKVGTGIETLSGISTYTGATNVSGGGTLLVSGSINGSSSLTVSNSRFELGASNVLGDNAAVALNSGTLALAGFSETAGTLSINTGVIDFGTGTGITTLQFADSSAFAWSGTLSITNWTGSELGGGTDQMFFGNSAGSLTPAQVSQVAFVNPFGFEPGTYGAKQLSTGELVAIPEPSSITLLVGAGFLLAGRFRRSAPLPQRQTA